MRRIVVVSIIGIDRFAAGFLAAKKVHEQAMLAGPIPVRILRGAWFHEFVPELVDWGTQDRVSYVPPMRTQLVAVLTVAEALVDLATAPDSAVEGTSEAPIPEIGGPGAENLVEVARLLTARRGDPVRIESASNPADPDRGPPRAGCNLARSARDPRRPEIRGVAQQSRAGSLTCPLLPCTFVVGGENPLRRRTS